MPRQRAVSLCVVLLMLASAIIVGWFAGLARATTYPTAAYHFDGTVANEFSANSVALLDLNKDGIADLVVGAPFNGTGAKANTGSVTFYLSNRSTLVPFRQVVTAAGSAAGDLFGWSVANVGNVSGAGPTLAVGAPHASPGGAIQAGNITLFYPSATFDGKPSAWINSTHGADATHGGEGLGYSIAAGGDINGDGFDDLLAGAPFCSTGASAGGCAYVYYGGSPHPHQVPDLPFYSTVAGANFGWSIAGNASVDGTSALDMVVGAPNYDAGGLASRGAVYMIRNLIGTVRTTIVPGVNAGDQFGFSVAMADFNGDTIADLAIGAPYNNDGFPQAGEVSIIYGASPFKTTIGQLLHGQAADEWFGYAMVSGNFHQDNFADLLVGAPGSTINATGVGRAYAYYGGSVAATSPNLTLVPGVSGANAFGSSLAVGGDFSGNKGPDFVVGDPRFKVGGNANEGRAYVYAGDVVPSQSFPKVLGWVCVPFTWVPATNSCMGLSGFTVTLESPTLPLTTTSTADGLFTFTAVPGTYWLNTTKFPYIDNSSSFPLAFNQVKNVVIFPYTLPVVRGNATDAVNRTKYAGVTVALYNTTNFLVNATTTSNTGAYSMFIPPAFLPAVGQAATTTVRMWDATHYTNQTTVSVRRNQTSSADLFLNRFPVVTGTVFNGRTLAPISGATVQATQGSTVIATATTNNRGVYNLVATNASVPRLLYFNTTSGGFGRDQMSLLVYQNQSYAQDIYLQPDSTPPISNVWPLLPTYTTAAVFSTSANASDNNDVQQVQLWYRFNNTGNYVKYAVDTSSPYTFSFNSTAARGDGRYEFYTIAEDYAGNLESAPSANDTWTWVDTHLPSLSVTKPTSGQLVLTSWVNVTWTARDSGSGLAKVELQLDSGAWIHAGLASFYNLTSVPDGSRTVTVNATDRAGNQRSASVSFSVNTAAPVVTFTSPANHSLSASQTVTVQWTITNPGTGIMLLQVRVDSGTWQTVGNTATSFTFTGLTDGVHNLWVHAVTASSASTMVYLSVTVDTTPPALSVTSPSGNPWVNTTSMVVTYAATDTTSGIAHVTVSLDNATSIDITGQTSYTITGLADGSHQLLLTATDKAGNAQSASASFRVDATPPTVTFNSPTEAAGFSTSTVAVQWLVTDAGSQVNTVQISLDGGAYQTVTPGGTQTFTGLADGQHTVTIRATDLAGNVRTASLHFTVSTQILGNNALVLGLAAAVVVVIVVIALVVWRMRKTKAPEAPKQEPPKPEGGEKKS